MLCLIVLHRLFARPPDCSLMLHRKGQRGHLHLVMGSADLFLALCSFDVFRENCSMDWQEAIRPAHPQAESAYASSEEPTYELQSLMRLSYAVFCLKTKQYILNIPHT